MTFNTMNLHPTLPSRLAKMGIVQPMGVQEETIIMGLANNDLMVSAPTGSGKTLAFLLPIVTKLLNEEYKQVLIVAPTRELAIQITDVAKSIIEENELGILACYGGQDIDKQLKGLKKQVNLIIGTTGRLMDLQKRGSLQLKDCDCVVLDEADQLLLMGFRDDIEKLMKDVPKNAQVMLFSATLDKKIKKLAYRYMDNPTSIEHDEKQVAKENLHQRLVHTTDRQKLGALVSLLNRENPFMAIIFCRTKRRVDELDEQLAQMKFNCQKLHSDVPQKKREQIMKAFRQGEIQYLVATDVAARGIDVSGISLVINYDVPEHATTYVHRIGRTARAGDTGMTYMFTVDRHQELLDEIESLLGYSLPTEDIVPSKNDGLMNQHYQGEKFKHRSINTRKKTIKLKR